MWTLFSVVLYLIYERTSKEPDDLLDGFVAFLPTGKLRHPWKCCLIPVRRRSGCSTSFEIL
jgi:hypothetical protein